jgi:ABC-type branched-subunit amino acid transport system substrate-binding protein
MEPVSTTRPARGLPTRPSNGRRGVASVLLGAVVACSMLVGACSSSASGDNTGSNNSGAVSSGGSKLSGDPVVVGVIGDDTGTVIQNPSGATLAQIAALDVNAHGGIHGRPLKVVTCDDQSDAQEAAVCARTLLQDDHAVVLAGVYSSSQGTAIYPALEQANTVNLFNYAGTPADQQNDLSFPALPGTAGTIGLLKTIPSGTTKVAVTHFPDTAADAAAENLIKGLPNGTTGYDVPVQPTTVDFQPTCLGLKSKGVQAVAVFIAAAPAQLLMSTCKQEGLDVTWLLPSAILSSANVKSISALGVKTEVEISYAGPAYDRMLADVQKYSSQVGGAPTDVIGDVVVAAWLGVYLAGKVLNAVPTLDGPAIKKYMESQTHFVTGMTPPINFSKPGPIATMPRVFNTSVAIGTIADGKIVANANSFVNFAN